MKLNDLAINFFSLLLFSLFYVAMAFARMQMDDSDLYRVIEQFSIEEMSPYTWREPIYWLFGKYITELTDSPWFAVVSLDLICFSLFVFKCKANRHSPLFVVALLLSPFLFLGITNIHRQLVAFIIWFCIVPDGKKEIRGFDFVIYLIPSLIHNSLLFFSLIHFFYRLGSNKSRILFLIICTPFIYVVLQLTAISEDVFREGTETSNSATIYLIWMLSLFTLFYRFFKNDYYVIYFLIASTLISIVMFEFSGGSSGSRMFLMTSLFLGMQFYLKKGSMNEQISMFRSLLLALILILPTITHPFTTEILMMPAKFFIFF